MKKILFYTLLLAVALTAGSCRRAAEKARQNIRVESVEKFERRGTAGFDLTLRVMNDTGYKLALNAARLELYFGDSPVGEVILREGVEVPRRTMASVGMKWQLKISDPLALFALTRKFQSGDLSQMFVSFDIDGKGGPKKLKISRKMIPLPEFLNIFGVSTQNIKDYLKE